MALQRLTRRHPGTLLRRLPCPRRYTEPHLATDNELVRNILLAVLSSLAKVEAQKISDRTRAGMARAKAKGIKNWPTEALD